MNISRSIIEEIERAIYFGNYIVNEMTDTRSSYLNESKYTGDIAKYELKRNINDLLTITKFITRYSLAISQVSAFTIPKQELDDLIEVLNNMYPRTLAGTIEILKYVATNSSDIDKLTKPLKQGDIGREIDYFRDYPTTIKLEISKSISDINDCLKSYKILDSYKRLTNKNYRYKSTNIQNVDSKTLIDDYTNCKNQIDIITNYGEIISENIISDDNTGYNELISKIVTFTKVLKLYYLSRIDILNLFVNRNKSRIKTKNIKSISIKPNNIDKSMDETEKTLEISKSRFDSIVKDIKRLEKYADERKYKEYDALFKRICYILEIPTDCMFDFDYNNVYIENSIAYVSIHILEDYNEETNISGKRLFHASSKEGLKEILPSLRNINPRLFYPEARIYAYVSFPLDRGGNFVSKYDYIYELENSFKIGYLDSDLVKNAIYIKTNKSIKIKKIVNREEFYKR